MATAEEYEKMSAAEKKKEDWMNSKWRPMMGWIYMLTCVTDFIIFPVLWSILQASLKQPVTAWQPITLQGAGLFHLSMGAIIGVAAFGRTQEKLAGAQNGGIQTPATGFASGSPAFGQPQSGGFGNSGGFNSPAPVTNSFGSQPLGGNSASFTPAPSWGTTPVSSAPTVVTGFGGKPAPMQEPQPLL